MQVAQRIDEHAKQELLAERERERMIGVWLVTLAIKPQTLNP